MIFSHLRSLCAFAAILISISVGAADFSPDKDNWKFHLGWEFPGATASLKWVNDPDKGAVMRVNYSFARGGRYINAVWSGKPPEANNILTFWVKGDVSTIRICGADGQWHAGRIPPTIPGKWSRVRIELLNMYQEAHWGGANDGKVRLPLQSLAIGSDNLKGKQFSVAGIVFSAPAKEVKSEWKLEFTTSQASGIAFRGEKVEYQLTAANLGNAKNSLPVIVKVESDSGKKNELHFDFKVKAGARESKTIRLDTAEIGFQSLEALTPDNQAPRAESGLAVVPQPVNYGKDDPDNFFGLCEIWDIAAAERIGCRTERWGIPWNYYGWDPGEDRLPILNDHLMQLTKHHMTALLTVSSWAPHWAMRKEPKYHNLPNDKNLPDWGKFMYRVAEYFRKHPEGKRIRIIEIDNEPDLEFWLQRGLSVEEATDIYTSMYKIARESVKKANPDQTFGGVGVSGGMFEMKMAFIDRVFAGGGKSDILTGHPYPALRNFGPGGNAPMPDEYGLDKRCKAGLDLMCRFNLPRRFMLGEYGWTLDPDQPPLSRYALLQAAAVARTFITSKAYRAWKVCITSSSVPAWKTVRFTVCSAEKKISCIHYQGREHMPPAPTRSIWQHRYAN